MRARRDAALRLLKIMLAASVLIPVAIFSYASWMAYSAAFARADEQINGRMDIMAEYATRIFQSVDLTFTSVDTLAGDLTDEDIKKSEQTLHDKLNKLEKSVVAIDGILIVDKKGRALVSSAVYPIPVSAGVADRDYFLAQVEHDAGTYVGAILQPRVRSDAFFGVSRRRPLRDGQFSGIVMVSVVPRVFVDFFAQLARDTG